MSTWYRIALLFLILIQTVNYIQYSERICCKFNSILKLDRKHADEIGLITQKEHFKNKKICFNLKEAIWSLTKKKKKQERKVRQNHLNQLTVEMTRLKSQKTSHKTKSLPKPQSGSKRKTYRLSAMILHS